MCVLLYIFNCSEEFKISEQWLFVPSNNSVTYYDLHTTRRTIIRLQQGISIIRQLQRCQNSHDSLNGTRLT